MRYLLLAIPFLFGFTYPVDLNEDYVMYNTSTTAVSSQRAWPRADGMAIDGLETNLIPLVATTAVKPPYDADTQFLFPNMVVDLPSEEYRKEWILMTLSAEDQTAIQAQNEMDAERLQAIAVYQDLKNGVGTDAERMVRIEKALAHLIRRKYQP